MFYNLIQRITASWLAFAVMAVFACETHSRETASSLQSQSHSQSSKVSSELCSTDQALPVAILHQIASDLEPDFDPLSDTLISAPCSAPQPSYENAQPHFSGAGLAFYQQRAPPTHS